MPFATFGVAPQRDGVVLGLSANTAVADATSIDFAMRATSRDRTARMPSPPACASRVTKNSSLAKHPRTFGHPPFAYQPLQIAQFVAHFLERETHREEALGRFARQRHRQPLVAHRLDFGVIGIERAVAAPKVSRADRSSSASLPTVSSSISMAPNLS